MNEKTKVQLIVQQLNIIDDTLFQKMAEDIGFCEEVISTVLGQNVIVKKVTPQKYSGCDWYIHIQVRYVQIRKNSLSCGSCGSRNR